MNEKVHNIKRISIFSFFFFCSLYRTGLFLSSCAFFLMILFFNRVDSVSLFSVRKSTLSSL